MAFGGGGGTASRRWASVAPTRRSSPRPRIGANGARFFCLAALAVVLVLIGRDRALAPFVLFRPVLMSHAGIQSAVRGVMRPAAEEEFVLHQEAFARAASALTATEKYNGDARPDPSEWRYARAYGVMAEPFSRRLLVDRGGATIPLSAAVVTLVDERPIFVGQVAGTADGAALVVGATDPGSRIPVEAGEIGSGLMLQGAFPAGPPRLLYVPRASSLRKGDEVRLSGPTRAAGALVGWVDSIDASANRSAPFVDVEVRPAVEIERLKHVWIENTSF